MGIFVLNVLFLIVWVQNANLKYKRRQKTSWGSAENLMYVEFTSCVQGIRDLFIKNENILPSIASAFRLSPCGFSIALINTIKNVQDLSNWLLQPQYKHKFQVIFVSVIMTIIIHSYKTIKESEANSIY